jgi:hypothetical protein
LDGCFLIIAGRTQNIEQRSHGWLFLDSRIHGRMQKLPVAIGAPMELQQ